MEKYLKLMMKEVRDYEVLNNIDNYTPGTIYLVRIIDTNENLLCYLANNFLATFPFPCNIELFDVPGTTQSAKIENNHESDSKTITSDTLLKAIAIAQKPELITQLYK